MNRPESETNDIAGDVALVYAPVQCRWKQWQTVLAVSSLRRSGCDRTWQIVWMRWRNGERTPLE